MILPININDFLSANMTGLMDKAIAKVNQNELDRYENFFQHSLFCI
jgi:hypothetical protein